jgi:hypothetical protein
VTHPDNLAAGYHGKTDWRLPTKDELIAAYYHGMLTAAASEWISAETMSANDFWSVSTDSNNTSEAWIVNLASGNASTKGKDETRSVVCVRP